MNNFDDRVNNVCNMHYNTYNQIERCLAIYCNEMDNWRNKETSASSLEEKNTIYALKIKCIESLLSDLFNMKEDINRLNYSIKETFKDTVLLIPPVIPEYVNIQKMHDIWKDQDSRLQDE